MTTSTQGADAFTQLRDHMQSCGIPQDQWNNVANCVTGWLTDVSSSFKGKSDYDHMITQIRSHAVPSSYGDASSSLKGESTSMPSTTSSPPGRT
jgi:hypothetical protein